MYLFSVKIMGEFVPYIKARNQKDADKKAREKYKHVHRKFIVVNQVPQV